MRFLPHTVLILPLLAAGLAAMPGPSARDRVAPLAASPPPVPARACAQEDPERVARELLLGAKDAISSGKVTFLRPHLGQKVYLNLFTGINGYYSSEQAYLILESLFSTHKPISFSFSSRNFSIRNPYGFGPVTFERRGKRETAELFISLAMVNDAWVISQITIATR